MEYILQQSINALGWGSVMALLGAGYTMTFGIIGLVNFAHGEVLMAGAIAAYIAMSVFGLPFWAGVIASIAGSVAIGLIIERVCFKPVRNVGMITLFIVSLGASIILRNLSILTLGDQLKPFLVPDYFAGVFTFGNLYIFKKNIIIFSLTVLIGVTLATFVRKTKLGVAMRSVSYDSPLSQTMGINTEKIIVLTFILSSILCGISAVFWGLLYGYVSSSIGVEAVVAAFIASVVGGIGNINGAIASGYILGIGGALFVAFLPPDLVGLRPLFLWLVFFLILFLKPSGLFRANIK